MILQVFSEIPRQGGRLCVPGVSNFSYDRHGSWQWDAKGLGIRTMPSWRTKSSVFAIA
jgi:hypothetical protein